MNYTGIRAYLVRVRAHRKIILHCFKTRMLFSPAIFPNIKITVLQRLHHGSEQKSE
nr:MAG TPA: hypothetical protein [Caudoviricetes sp.]